MGFTILLGGIRHPGGVEVEGSIIRKFAWMAWKRGGCREKRFIGASTSARNNVYSIGVKPSCSATLWRRHLHREANLSFGAQSDSGGGCRQEQIEDVRGHVGQIRLPLTRPMKEVQGS